MIRTRVQSPVAALVLSLTAAAPPADPAEDEAMKAILKWGGTVNRVEGLDTRPVIAIDLGMNQVVTDAGLKAELGVLKELEALYLHWTRVTDAEVKN